MHVRLSAARRASVLAAAVLSGSAVLAGCSSATDGHDQAAATRAVRARVVANGNVLDQRVPAVAANASLVDQHGRKLSLRSLHGKVVVLAPLLTLCQETCPMTTEEVHRAAAATEAAGGAGQVVFLEVTVDPERDTVRRMHAYARLYGGLPNWRLATGRPAAVRAMWKALGVITQKAPSDEPVRDWMTGRLLRHSYDVHHQDVVVVIAQSGRLRWITVGHPDARGARLPATMQEFLNDEGRRNLNRPGAGGASSWTAHDVEQAVHFVRSSGGD